MEYNEFTKHFPQKVSKELERYVTNTVFRKSRYLFYKTGNGIQSAYCTHCGESHTPKTKLKHKQVRWVPCPHCGSQCNVRAAGMSRGSMRDFAVFVWYERSRVNPQAITARIIEVCRDYSGDFHNVETKHLCAHRYLFEPGRSYYFWGSDKSNKVCSAFDRHYGGWCRTAKHMSLSNIRKAVKGTPFQYQEWEKFTKYANQDYVSDMTEFFDLAVRYPCVEYLSKSGFENMIWPKLYKDYTYSAISWYGRTLSQVLRLTKAEIKEAKSLGKLFKPKHLRYFQLSKKKGLPISVSDSLVLAEIDDGYYFSYYKKFVKASSEDKVLKYILKQIRNGHYDSSSSVLIDWNDYMKECEQLGIDATKEHRIFPNNLKEAHMRTSKRIKMKADKKVNAMIETRLPELDKFRFEYKGLFLRPAASSIELFQEGKTQSICIGSYAERYGKGGTDLFFIRKLAEPEKPFYAMEVNGIKIIQCRGLKNCSPTQDVAEFVNKFVREKLSAKKRKSKSNKPQGVAV